ncbi:phosphate acyltransferase PlsX [Gemella haemolysans]|uniref:Phosphate acyltransferase n=2 Tax=Gemella haemolysans TaxID=1379 RepID=A0AA87DS23_9BACL|nr:phosphate acyltransferase PlsX [Gemella haemolysans]EGF86531.1 fatty acid/phospholipid synthesis protein PlsX [Gemella haemolysans M341]QIX87718.1 phosphate acyltransferase PlsX [Gemella haemolysans]
MHNIMKIGIDILGVDEPSRIVNFVNSYKDEEVELYVYGLEENLNQITKTENIIKNVCTEEVLMSDDAARVHRKKKDASMIRMLSDLNNDVIDVAISGGSTGAFMASSLFMLGRIEGISKPGLASLLPTKSEHKFLLTDLGANVEAKPDDLVNYAKLGQLYMKYIYNIETPSVALLNVGVEESKGNKVYKEAHKLLKEDINNFKGNIEAREILEHKYDIVISDGFAGNVLLKTIEGVASTLGSMIKGIFMENIKTKISALLVKSGITKFKKKFDYSEYGGAFLLGIKKPSIKVHGSADENALYYAVQQAKQIHKTKLYDIMIETMEKGE